MQRLVVFGCGFVGRAAALRWQAAGGEAIGTARTQAGADALQAAGVSSAVWLASPSVDFLDASTARGDAWLVSVPPDEAGCPVFRALSHAAGRRAGEADWIGYLSTTGVYGDLGGGWAFEETPRAPLSREAANRVRAENEWLSVGAHVFRLPGIYGPGRSQLDKVREPGARRIVKPGQVFSRAHRDDIAAALLASMARPDPGAIYNICDDEPAPADEVLAYATTLLGLPPPPAVAFEDAGLSPAAQRFYAECKRVSNAKAKAALNWLPAYPTYREGLAGCLV